MENWTAGVSRLILDRTVEELFASMIVALVIAGAAAPLGAWLCRSREDGATRLTAVMFVSTLLGMIVAGSFVEREHQSAKGSLALAPPPHHFNPGWRGMRRLPMYYQMKGILDADGDGHVSTEEFQDASEALGTEDRLQHSGPPMAPSDGGRGDVPRPRRAAEGI
ncbi:hypothetical protein [Tautonia plasticadhaerens]|uniref:EF-hand domain-containing protein n=1 Tax=Tautonia plasticadhaerens TaxID=2527974 RepID=A0A518H6R1_9BACT|nr:hypothetical protein [Tautonia plasticadhaerens]QDV36503.1 hypothetical protein ElP_44290 [Tautonia plasticadhaerens]